jgi:hypothetical protein
VARVDKTLPGQFVCPCCGQTEDQHNYVVPYDTANVTAYTGSLPPKKRGFGFPIWWSTLRTQPPSA